MVARARFFPRRTDADVADAIPHGDLYRRSSTPPLTAFFPVPIARARESRGPSGLSRSDRSEKKRLRGRRFLVGGKLFLFSFFITVDRHRRRPASRHVSTRPLKNNHFADLNNCCTTFQFASRGVSRANVCLRMRNTI